MKKNVIVSVPNVKALGGAERYAVILSQVLAENPEYQVYFASEDTSDFELIAKYYNADLSRVIPIDFVQNVGSWANRLPQSLKNIVTDYLRAKQFKSYNPEIFFECGYKSEIPGMAKKNFYICHFPHNLTVPTRSVGHRVFLYLGGFLRKLLLNEGKEFYATYNRVIANSQFTQHHVLNRWGVTSSVIEPPCAMAEKVDLSLSRKKRIINIGRFEMPAENIPHKSQHVLISAFKKMDDLHSGGWELHLVGTVSESGRTYFERLKAEAEGYPIYFHPDASYNDLQNLMKESSIYWHAQGYGTDQNQYPETQEHFGITTVEAMSAGLIPVVINSAGPREVVEADPELVWDSTSELIEKTVSISKKSIEEQQRIRNKVLDRAHSFDNSHFAQKVNSLITSTKD